MTETKGQVPLLSQIYFYLTQGCNLACRHCWLAPGYDADAKRYPVLPTPLFARAIDEAMPLGLEGVKLTGGEPLLHPDFLRLAEIAGERNLRLVIETNGLLCTEEIARAVASLPHRFVSVSIDGADAETHDSIRGVAGSFQRATQAVRFLASAGLRPQVIFTVMRANAGQVDTIVSLAEGLGAGSVKFNVVQPAARGRRMRDDGETLTVPELISLGRYVEKELSARTSLTLFFDYPHAFRSLSRIASGDGCGVCGILGIIGVIPSGHYALCGIGEHLPELTFGRVGEDRLDRIWRGHPLLTLLREDLPERLEGICGRCLMKHRCMGACVAQNYYLSRNLFAPYWFCEEAERQGLFPFSRLAARNSTLPERG